MYSKKIRKAQRPLGKLKRYLGKLLKELDRHLTNCPTKLLCDMVFGAKFLLQTRREDRIDFLKRVVELLGISRIERLLADREFIGTQWFRFLIEWEIPFIIRVKQNSMVKIGENGKLPIGRLWKWLSRKKVVNQPLNLWGLSLYVSIEKKKGAKEQMIVISNFKFEDPLGMCGCCIFLFRFY